MARRIRDARLAAGLTQEAAAAKARLAYKYWQDIERGVVDLHVTTLAQIARGLRVPLGQLLEPVVGRPPTRRVGRPPVARPPRKVAVTATTAKKAKKKP